jgi:5-hydroxyisourate hydrolase
VAISESGGGATLASGVTLRDPPFLDKVVIHFAIYEDKDHYHVPLLCSPWSHST